MSADLAPRSEGLSLGQHAVKRFFDVGVAVLVLVIVGWAIPVAALLVRLDGGGPGVYRQVRIGRDGRPFTMLKLRTMRPGDGDTWNTTVTTSNDPRITSFGGVLRRTKLDELPQFVNVLKGDMSLVGPRPDVPGFADELEGDDRIVLSVRPGITGPATLAFRHEEQLLARQREPERFNREVLFPAKTQMNRKYVQSWRFRDDLRYLWLTVAGDSESASLEYPQ